MTKDLSGGLARVASAAGDGEVRVWDLGDRKSLWHVQGGHRGMVKGVVFSHPGAGEEGRMEKEIGKGEKSLKRKRTDPNGKGKARVQDEDEEEEQDREDTVARGSAKILSCGVDKMVRLWDIKGPSGTNVKVSPPFGPLPGFAHGCPSLCRLTLAKRPSSEFCPIAITLADQRACSSISHHRYDPIFATASSAIEIWDLNKTSPISTLKFHSTSSIASGEQIVSVAFNKSETSVLAASGSDRTVCLYDLRVGKAVGRVAMNVRPLELF